MKSGLKEKERIFIGIAAIIGWVAICTQFYVTMSSSISNDESLSRAVIKYFSYFTILTNLLVATSLTLRLLSPESKAGKFFSRPEIIAAILVYILIVGIIYSLMLRQLWQPQGIGWIADELLHDVMPVLFLIGWLIFTPKEKLKWASPVIWLIYPVLYIIYTIIRGIMTGEYPYPFVDVNILGYPQVMINTFFVLLGFVIIGLIIVVIGKIMVKKPV